MKTVHILNGQVHEIIPTYALPAAQWYGAEFAAECVEASDDVMPGWTYNAESGTFSAPMPAEEVGQPEPTLETRVADLETDVDQIITGLEAITA